MIHLHATRKLFAALPKNDMGQLPAGSGAPCLSSPPHLAENPLDHWHGNLVSTQRRESVVLVHDATRFAVVLPGLKKSDFTQFNARFVDAFMNTLLKCGASDRQMEAAHDLLRPLLVDTTCDRSVQATVTQVALEFEHALEYQGVSVAEITGYRMGAWLSESPRTVKGRGRLWPKDLMLALLDAQTTVPSPT